MDEFPRMDERRLAQVVKLVLVCLTAIPALDSCYPRRYAVTLREVAIGGLTAWIGGSTCGFDCIMSTLWSSKQHGTQKGDYSDVRMT